ncbi:MAG: hypothetical protein ACK4IZ_03365 [Flavobacterium sp.]|uniref:hypothetical protein n=1 Tax=Flavobacterium sp. TaxID=239 RepID=UPI00391D0258
MSLQKLNDKANHLKTAFESIDELVNNHEEEVLRPIKTYLKQQLEKTKAQIDKVKKA